MTVFCYIWNGCKIFISIGASCENRWNNTWPYGYQSEFRLFSLPECQGTPCSKQAPYLKFKRQQRDSNPQPLSSYNIQPFSQTGLSIRFRIKWLWIRIPLLSLKVKVQASFHLNTFSLMIFICFRTIVPSLE